MFLRLHWNWRKFGRFLIVSTLWLIPSSEYQSGLHSIHSIHFVKSRVYSRTECHHRWRHFHVVIPRPTSKLLNGGLFHCLYSTISAICLGPVVHARGHFRYSELDLGSIVLIVAQRQVQTSGMWSAERGKHEVMVISSRTCWLILRRRRRSGRSGDDEFRNWIKNRWTGDDLTMMSFGNATL